MKKNKNFEPNLSFGSPLKTPKNERFCDVAACCAWYQPLCHELSFSSVGFKCAALESFVLLNTMGQIMKHKSDEQSQLKHLLLSKSFFAKILLNAFVVQFLKSAKKIMKLEKGKNKFR